jgi:uncharacterized Zn finger protein
MSKRRNRWPSPRARRGRFDGYGFAVYQTVASKRLRAERDLARLRKADAAMAPIVIEGRKIASTFWGEAWCDNLERYSDFANRLPRGRSYVRNGAVIDLRIAPGIVSALVSGTDVYDVRVQVAALPTRRWRAVRQDVSGTIDSVIELLQGRLSDQVMTRLCAEGTGLFPSPREISFSCSCPDWASMCKHVAAVLYGIGARLDHAPALLFTLRQVEADELVGGAGARAAAGLARPGSKAGTARKVVEESALADVFGIDIVGAGAKGTTKRAKGGTRAAKKPKTRRKRRAARSKHED